MRSFVKIKPSRIGDITLSFTDIGKACHVCDFYIANVSFNVIRENQILAKISEFTVITAGVLIHFPVKITNINESFFCFCIVYYKCGNSSLIILIYELKRVPKNFWYCHTPTLPPIL